MIRDQRHAVGACALRQGRLSFSRSRVGLGIACAATAFVACKSTPEAAGRGSGGTGQPVVVAGAVLDSSQVKEDPVAGKKAEAQLLKHLAREDRHLWLLFDHQHLHQHQAVLAALLKARARYEKVRSPRELDLAQQEVGGLLDGARDKMREIDEWRNGSKVFGDYDVLIRIIESDYPAALRASLSGNPRMLNDVRRESDGQVNKLTSWLAEAAKEPEEEPEEERD